MDRFRVDVNHVYHHSLLERGGRHRLQHHILSFACSAQVVQTASNDPGEHSGMKYVQVICLSLWIGAHPWDQAVETSDRVSGGRGRRSRDSNHPSQRWSLFRWVWFYNLRFTTLWLSYSECGTAQRFVDRIDWDSEIEIEIEFLVRTSETIGTLWSRSKSSIGRSSTRSSRGDSLPPFGPRNMWC